MKLALFVLYIVVLCILALMAKASDSCAMPVSWNYQPAPHEQQPEPMMAKHGFGGERWVL
jgi:hypothetical protein